eukprot:COSAG06_NODE_1377_length_9648_cov_2.243062_2_plen_36_part_00
MAKRDLAKLTTSMTSWTYWRQMAPRLLPLPLLRMI